MGFLMNGLGMGQQKPGPINYQPPYPGAGQPVGSPTLTNGAWDDGPQGYYGPKGAGYGLKEGETMTIDPSSDNALGPKSLADKAITAGSKTGKLK